MDSLFKRWNIFHSPWRQSTTRKTCHSFPKQCNMSWSHLQGDEMIHPAERIWAKATRTYIRTYCMFRGWSLSENISLRYAKLYLVQQYSTWEYAVDTQLLTLQRPQDGILHTFWNLDRQTPVRALARLLQKFFTVSLNYAGHNQK